MGSTQHSNGRRSASIGIAAAGVLALAGLGACSAGAGDDDAAEPVAATTPALGDQDGGGESAAEDAATAPSPAGRPGAGPAPTQVLGRAVAIEARASVEAEDVGTAVERITGTVTASGGRVAAADIDYAAPGGDDDGGDEDDDGASSRATLVVEVPPAALDTVRDALEDVGTVLSYDQLAEDVTDQLTDLQTRITNQRASIARVRELYADAADVETVVRIEAELTNRETLLEQLLASQQQVEQRVAMSTLTIDIAATPGAADAGDDAGLADALSGGWGAFVGAAFAVVLVLAAALPFLLTALAVALAATWVLGRSRRRSSGAGAPASPPAPAPAADEVRAEPVSASRPE